MRICAGGFLVRGEQVLLAKRSPVRRLYPDVWGAAGGHCEGHEAPAETLVREVADELGATAQAFEEIAVLEELHPDEHGEARYHVFVVTVWEGREPRMPDSEQVVGVSGR